LLSALINKLKCTYATSANSRNMQQHRKRTCVVMAYTSQTQATSALPPGSRITSTALPTTSQRIFLPSLLTFQARGGRENSSSTGGALSRQWGLDDPRTTKQPICRVIPNPLPEEVQREGNGETTAKAFITAPCTGAASRKSRVKV
jgi:hypothetical protein